MKTPASEPELYASRMSAFDPKRTLVSRFNFMLNLNFVAIDGIEIRAKKPGPDGAPQ
jgi:hypothetical protein